jgi:hypothetical protein
MVKSLKLWKVINIIYTFMHFPTIMQELCFLIWVVARFSRGPVETTLPPRRKQVYGRLSSSVEDDIEKLHNDASNEQKTANGYKSDKRDAEVKLEDLDKKMRSIKVNHWTRRWIIAIDLSQQKLNLKYTLKGDS